MGTKTELLNIFGQLSDTEREEAIKFMRGLRKSKKANLNLELSLLDKNESKHLEEEFEDYKELYPKNE